MARKRIQKSLFDSQYYDWLNDPENHEKQRIYAANLKEIAEQVMFDTHIWEFKKADFRPALILKAVQAGARCEPGFNNGQSSAFSYIYSALFRHTLTLNAKHIKNLEYIEVPIDDINYDEMIAEQTEDFTEQTELIKLKCLFDSCVSLLYDKNVDLDTVKKNLLFCGVSREELFVLMHVSGIQIPNIEVEMFPELSNDFKYKIDVLTKILQTAKTHKCNIVKTTQNIIRIYNMLIKRGYIITEKITPLYKNLSRYVDSKGFTLMRKPCNDGIILYIDMEFTC